MQSFYVVLSDWFMTLATIFFLEVFQKYISVLILQMGAGNN